jgi:hypothetical protein
MVKTWLTGFSSVQAVCLKKHAGGSFPACLWEFAGIALSLRYSGRVPNPSTPTPLLRLAAEKAGVSVKNQRGFGHPVAVPLVQGFISRSVYRLTKSDTTLVVVTRSVFVLWLSSSIAWRLAWMLRKRSSTCS